MVLLTFLNYMRLIQLTDPHLSSLESFSFLSVKGKRKSGYLSWYRKRRHIHRPEILERLTQAVQDESPDQILLTGDLVHIGLEDEIIEAARWLRRIATGVIICLHSKRESMNIPPATRLSAPLAVCA